MPTNKPRQSVSVDRLRRHVATDLAIEPALTPKSIRDSIDRFRAVLQTPVSDDEAENLAREFEYQHDIELRPGHILHRQDPRPWLDSARSNIDFEPYYWNRYRDLLAVSGFPPKVIASTDRTTDDVLDLLGNPDEPSAWDRRGLVVGHVQSGKTANYIALSCKAADAGYRIIIIITGIQDRLRRQTQIRVNEGLIGRDMSHTGTRDTRVGVGLRDFRRQPNPFTHATRDFDKDAADAMRFPFRNLREPAVFVIKKNTHTLTNLLAWLRSQDRRDGALDYPLLLIDDEADNASINIQHRQDEVSRINSQIRDILSLFARSCYVGYTATPFANIFIEPSTDDEMLGHDLFPRDFIKSLDAPTNYYGPREIFADDGPRPVRYITDNGDVLPTWHRKGHQLDTLPDSLRKAARAFLLTCAIRQLRGHRTAHKSMLVHASRFIPVQRQIRLLLHDYLDRVRQSVRVHGAKPSDDADRSDELRDLRLTFEEEYSTCQASWADVRDELHSAIGGVRVVEVNHKSDTPLDYSRADDGLTVIAVGGNSLSRGLTLEGLVVSYFLRNSQMYDTLMQMGRWFGYRDGYADLCRIWMLESAEDWYSHISDSFEELRDEFRLMSQARATPRDFGLRVRSHPDSLVVTARNKIGTGKPFRHSVRLAKSLVETSYLALDPKKQQANRDAARRLSEQLRADGFALENGRRISGGRCVTGVSVAPILDFLSEFENDNLSRLTERKPLCEYIRRRVGDELATWDVFIPGVKQARPETLIDRSLGFRLLCQRRAPGTRKLHALMVTSRQRVASRGVEKIGLSRDQRATVEREYREHKNRPDGPQNYPDHIYRAVRKRPLLILHMLAIGEKGDDLSATDPVVAYSISFPDTEHDQDTVEFIVNAPWLAQLGPSEAEWEDSDDDDD